MTTRAEFRSKLRRRLEDEDTSEPVWSDNVLNDAIDAAILDYSAWFSRIVETTISGVAGQNDYELRDAIDVSYVRHPDTGESQNIRDYMTWITTLAYDMTTSGYYYFAFQDGTLRLLSPPETDGDIRVGYETYYTLPVDDSQELSVWDADLDLLLLYAHFWLLRGDATKDALLARWDESPGRRDDNPVVYMSDRLLADYTRMINQRKAFRRRPDRARRRT